MTVSVSNTNLTDSFNSWRLNTNLAATVISNNAVTVYRAGSSARGKAVIGNTHIKGTVSAVELRTDTIKGGNAAMGTTGKSGAVVIASNTSVTGTSLTVAANTTFTGNVIFNTAGADRVNLGSIDRVIVSGGGVGQFLRIAGPATDNPQFKALTLRDITDLSSNSAHIILSGANTTFSAGAKDSPHLILAGGSNSGADRFHIFAGDNTTAGDDDLIIQLTDNVGDSKLNINNAANTNMATIDSRGLLTANGASFSEDVTFTGAATNMVWDKSDNALEFADNTKATFGAGADLQIYHDGTQSYIRDTATGSLRLTSNEVLINNENDNEASAKFIQNGAVELYHDNSEKLTTKADGVDITGELQSDTLDVDGAADISGTATLGAVTVTGATTLNGDVTLGNASTDTITTKGNFANAVFAGTVAFNGNVTVGNANTDTLTVQANTTFNSGVNITGGSAVAAPTGTFTTLNVTGTGNLNGAVNLGDASTDVITTKGKFANAEFTGPLALGSSLRNGSVSGTVIVGSNGKLHANNTITNGTIKGVMLENSGVSAATYGSATTFPIVTVDAQGLLTGVTTGTLNDATDSAKGIASFSTDNFSVSSGAVTIKDNGVIMGTETTGNYVATVAGTANEVNVSGSGSETAAVVVGLPDEVTITQDLTVGRHLLMGDSDTIKLGAGPDLQIYHDGSHSYINDSGTGNLKILGSQIDLLGGTDGGETMATFVDNGAVSLYYDNAVKFATDTEGANITGQLDLSSHLDMPDDAHIKLGTGDDLSIYHNGDDSFIVDSGTGSLTIQASQLNVRNAANSETGLTFAENGAITLYHDNAAKLATKADGVDITGELQSDTLDVDGNADISGTLTVANVTVTGTLGGVGSIEADTIIPAASADTTAFLAFFESATGAQGIKTDTGLTYNADTNALTTTTFVGALTGAVTGNVTGDVTGNVTGNASGTAATVTGAAQSNITSVGTLTGLTLSGNVTISNSGNRQLAVTSTDAIASIEVGGTTGAFIDLKRPAGDDYDLRLASGATGGSITIGSGNFSIIGTSAKTMALFTDGAAATLYHNGSSKLTTTSSGATITGTATATTFSGSGASLTSLPAGQLTGTVAAARMGDSYSLSTSGNAGTATALQTSRNINGVGFNGTAAITVEPHIDDDESTNAARYLTFVDNSTAGYKRLNEDSALFYNPSTNTLTAGVFSGSGASLTSVGRIISVQEFTSSGTWSRPTGCTRIHVLCVGGGGGARPYFGGDKKNSAYEGQNGGLGGSAEEVIDVTGTASVSVTVGAGGAANGAGATSSFGSLCSATGGAAGTGNYPGGGLGANGSGSGGHINRSHNNGGYYGDRGDRNAHGHSGSTAGVQGVVYVINY